MTKALHYPTGLPGLAGGRWLILTLKSCDSGDEPAGRAPWSRANKGSYGRCITVLATEVNGNPGIFSYSGSRDSIFSKRSTRMVQVSVDINLPNQLPKTQT
jgi:hypothetical protein